MTPQKMTALLRRFSLTIWICAGFIVLGYFPTLKLHTPVWSLAAAPCAVIYFGSRAKNLTWAILRGTGLGFLAGVAMVAGILAQAPLSPNAAVRLMEVYIPASTLLCLSVSALFAHLAALRKKRIESQWQ